MRRELAICKLEFIERLRFMFTPNSRREFVPRDQVSTYFPFTLYCFYTKISSFIPVLTMGIVRDCFCLLIFYSEKVAEKFTVCGKRES